VIKLQDVRFALRATCALDGISLDVGQRLPAAACRPGWMARIQPVGAGWTGTRRVQQAELRVLGGDMQPLATSPGYAAHRLHCPRAWGEQPLPTLTVNENARFFARLVRLGAAAEPPQPQRCLCWSAPGSGPSGARPAASFPGG